MNISLIDLSTYKIGKVLGKGAFGEVKLATDPNGKKVAIKFMHDMDADTLLDLKQEVDILKNISTEPNCHPGIVCYHGLFLNTSKGGGKGDKEYILIMDYIEGYDLKKYNKCQIKTGWTVDAEDFKRLFIYLLEALEFMHSKGVAHRDIKPDNLIFTKDRIVIVDLGLACYTDKNKGKPICSSGSGTPFYMPPEIINFPSPPPEASGAHDIWSLGCSMYEIANIWGVLGPNDMIQQHANKWLMPLSILPNKQIGKVISACFESDWKLRPTASDLLKVLRDGTDIKPPGTVRENYILHRVCSLKSYTIEDVFEKIITFSWYEKPGDIKTYPLELEKIILHNSRGLTCTYEFKKNLVGKDPWQISCNGAKIQDVAEFAKIVTTQSVGADQFEDNVYYNLYNKRHEFALGIGRANQLFVIIC
jgi:serine/threonine protein kinase